MTNSRSIRQRERYDRVSDSTSSTAASSGERLAVIASRMLLTMALPTMAPSAWAVTARTWAAVEIPNPAAIGSEVVARMRAIKGAMSGD